MLKQRVLQSGTALLCAALIATTSAGCNKSAEQSKEGGAKVIKIVSSLPRQGSAKAQTDTIVNAIKLALEEANHKAGDFTIVYQDLDDSTATAGNWTGEQETANAQSAAEDKDVMVYIGPFNSGAAMISVPILNRAGLLMISPSNTYPGLTKKGFGQADEPAKYRQHGINYTRVVPTDDLQGPLGARWAKEMGLTKVYVLDDGDLYGKGIADVFEAECQDIGIKVLGHESIDPKQLEFRSLMLKVKSKMPDLVYFGGTSQTRGGNIARDLVAEGVAAKLMVPDGCMETAFIETAGAGNLNNRCYVTFSGLSVAALLDQGGAAKKFVESYRKKHSADPEVYAIYGYEAAKAALRAIQDAGKKDRKAVVGAALALKDFKEGALGTWSFDENGDTTRRAMNGYVVKDANFVFVKELK